MSSKLRKQMHTFAVAQSSIFPTRKHLNTATSCIPEARVQPVKAASPLAKAAELCYVNVGDGRQQLPALFSPFSLQCGAFCSHCSLSPWKKKDAVLLEVSLQVKHPTNILKCI